MNVGDYCYIKGKNRDYGIGKIVQLNSGYSSNGGELIDILFKHSKHAVPKKDVISSPQIIDLIEVGDFITYKQGNFYWNVFEQVSARYNRENQMTDLIVDNKPLNTVEILTVITHEQMEAMQYRVEE